MKQQFQEQIEYSKSQMKDKASNQLMKEFELQLDYPFTLISTSRHLFRLKRSLKHNNDIDDSGESSEDRL